MSDPAPDPVVETAVARPAEAPAGTVPSPPPSGSPLSRAMAAVFLQDLPLKGLALLLAILTWQLVRERLETKITLTDIQVDVADVPSDVALVGPATRRVQITLLGTRAEVERARAMLEEDPHVRVSLPKLPPGADAGTTPALKQPVDFRYPFERPDLVMSGDSVELDWVRVAERSIPVVPPEVDLKPGSPHETVPGNPVLETTKVRVRGPKQVVEALTSLRPDPILTSPWIDDWEYSTPKDWFSGFDSWRGKDPLRSERVLSIEPAIVKGKLKVRLIAAPRAVEHALRLVLPAGPADKLARWEVRVDGGPEYDRTSRRIRLTLKGDKKTLDELEANPDDWSYVAEIPAPSDGGEPLENVATPVRLLLGVVPSTGKPLGAGVILEGNPTVQVTLKKKPQ